MDTVKFLFFIINYLSQRHKDPPRCRGTRQGIPRLYGGKKAFHYLTTSGLTRYTEHTTTDINRYLEQIHEVRNSGFALDREEYLRGVRAVAAIISTGVPPLAAIWVVGFSSSLTDTILQTVIEKTLYAADAISHELKRNKGT
jgi:DNA-binding IclR family transcriptional regulator